MPNLNELDQLVAEARKRKAATPEGTEPIAFVSIHALEHAIH